MKLTYSCECGYTVKGTSEDEFVEDATVHCRIEHNVELTRQQALAMATIED